MTRSELLNAEYNNNSFINSKLSIEINMKINESKNVAVVVYHSDLSTWN